MPSQELKNILAKHEKEYIVQKSRKVKEAMHPADKITTAVFGLGRTFEYMNDQIPTDRHHDFENEIWFSLNKDTGEIEIKQFSSDK